MSNYVKLVEETLSEKNVYGDIKVSFKSFFDKKFRELADRFENIPGISLTKLHGFDIDTEHILSTIWGPIKLYYESQLNNSKKSKKVEGKKDPIFSESEEIYFVDKLGVKDEYMKLRSSYLKDIELTKSKLKANLK